MAPIAKQNNTKKKTWRVASYSRLSVEDTSSDAESNSISNQKILIKNYIDNFSELKLVDEFVDDGWSGTNFNRPAFQEMMKKIDEGKIDCIVVKDLSRFGRNYLEMGRYLEQEFPSKGVRLLAINDYFDTLTANASDFDLIVPIKNLINDNYAASTSAKVKASLEVKRNRGDYIASFAPYGYAKDSNNKSKLVIDEDAAATVRKIFSWRLDGYSAGGIAIKLNELGIPSPYEYKVENGSKARSPFKRGLKAQWSQTQVLRILSDEVYIGNLLQGKRYKPSFRSKERIDRPKEQWIRTDNTHEPIIDLRTFTLVTDIAKRDSRSPSAKDAVYLLAGFVYCGDCGDSMYRMSQVSRGKRYSYYKCTTHHADKTKCSTHAIRAEQLEQIVADSVFSAIRASANKACVKKNFSTSTSFNSKIEDLERRRDKALNEYNRCSNMAHKLYDDMSRGIITQKEMEEFRAAYDLQAATYAQQAEALGTEIENLKELNQTKPWQVALQRWLGATELTRCMLVELVERIEVYEGGIVNIVFRFQDAYNLINEEA